MHMVVNDLSFSPAFRSEQEAQKAINDFLEICHELDSGKYHAYTGIVSFLYETRHEICPGMDIYYFLERMDRDEATYLKGILHGVHNHLNTAMINGETAEHFVYADDGAMISLRTQEASEPFLIARTDGREIAIKNISCISHLDNYWKELDRCVYEASPKHGNKAYNIAKGKNSSPMTLDRKKAQHLLNRSLRRGKALYAKDGEHYYAFRGGENTGVYHGFEGDETIIEPLRRELDRRYREGWFA